MNAVQVIGRLTKDVIVENENGHVYSEMQIIIDRQMVSEEREKIIDNNNGIGADFPKLIAYGKNGEMAKEYLTRGKLIGVTGELRTKNINGKYEMYVEVNTIKFL